MLRLPFWVFSLAGFFFFFFLALCFSYTTLFSFQPSGFLSFFPFFFLFFFFLFFFFGLSSLDWMIFWGPFALLVFLLMNFSHFDALSRLLSCLNALAPFCTWWIFFFLLDKPSTLLGMMNFRFFKLDAHFIFFLTLMEFLSLIEWKLILLRWSLIFSLMNFLN